MSIEIRTNEAPVGINTVTVEPKFESVFNRSRDKVRSIHEACYTPCYTCIDCCIACRLMSGENLIQFKTAGSENAHDPSE